MSTLPNDSIGSKREHFPVISSDSIIRMLSVQTMPLSSFFSSHLINWRKQKQKEKSMSLQRGCKCHWKAKGPVPPVLPSLVQLLLLKCWLTGVLYFPVSQPEGGSLLLETQFMYPGHKGAFVKEQWVQGLKNNFPSHLEPYRLIIQ